MRKGFLPGLASIGKASVGEASKVVPSFLFLVLRFQATDIMRQIFPGRVTYGLVKRGARLNGARCGRADALGRMSGARRRLCGQGNSCRCGWQASHSGRGRQVIGSFGEGLAPLSFTSLLTSFS